MAGGQVRYARYILLAVVTLFALYFLSSSSIPTHYEKYSKYAQPLKDQMPSFGNPWERLQSQAALDNPIPSQLGVPVESDSPVVEPTSPVMESVLAEVAPGERVNATFVTLARNADLWEIARSIRQVEDRFNRKYNYPWVFLNDAPFEENFVKVTSSLVSGKTYYGVIPAEHWSFPEWIDQDRARLVREDMRARKIIYGDSISYRHMCRFESGFFFRQKLLEQFEYYWRVEPSIELFCDIAYDPFRFMKDNNKQYSFVLSLYEYIETIPTLWKSVKKFMNAHPEHLASNNALGFLSDDGGETYNKCHFWSNFEIGNLNWLRSQQYLEFFDSLDRDGGFFYERWGDAPIHSIAAGLMLNKTDIHFFNDIAYYHVPFTHCPTGDDLRLKLKCHCDPKNNFDWKGYSCTNRCWTWVFFKSAVLSATAMCGVLFIIMNIPFTRRRILRLADKLADWHERGVTDDDDDDDDDGDVVGKGDGGGGGDGDDRYTDKDVRAVER